ncbi:MAG: TraR/DksA C4-type zinc finger protein [Candidatus Buchananbacteria bacterium]|nr:TraR/DksA C4-type zinc finger protein [Candidatus Buchananbacteria bacterium]
MINIKSMDKQLFKDIKKQLEERKEVVMGQLGSIGHQEKSEPGEEINFNADFPQYGESAEDNAVEVADYAKNLSVERELEKELRDIEKAIKKIDDGTYGICNHCGQPIEAERLRVRPESGSCVSCKKAITRK